MWPVCVWPEPAEVRRGLRRLTKVFLWQTLKIFRSNAAGGWPLCYDQLVSVPRPAAGLAFQLVDKPIIILTLDIFSTLTGVQANRVQFVALEAGVLQTFRSCA
jgi:hypothetical protein